jgi:anti-sigma factor RsiW
MDNKLTCDPTLLSRFFDGELDAEEGAEVAEHVTHCATCRARLEELKTLSEDIRSFLSERGEQESPGLEQKVIKAIQRDKAPGWMKAKAMILSKRVLIPVSAAACGVVIFFSLFYSPAVSGPSAIVTSLSGSGSSVFILETPRTRQTILWFDEKG